MKNILTENHEKLDQQQATAMNIAIDENWFTEEVRNFIISIHSHSSFSMCNLFLRSNRLLK